MADPMATIGRNPVTGDYRCTIHRNDWWHSACVGCVTKKLERTEQIMWSLNERLVRSESEVETLRSLLRSMQAQVSTEYGNTVHVVTASGVSDTEFEAARRAIDGAGSGSSDD